MEGIKNFASKNNLSSAHITFCSFDEFKKGESLGFLKRTNSQFHWKNDNYKNFQDFLNALSSRKRKNIKKNARKQETLEERSFDTPVTKLLENNGMHFGIFIRIQVGENGANLI